MISDFEKEIIMDEDLENLNETDVKSVMEMCRYQLNKIKMEKTEFINTTNLKEGTRFYNKEIASYNHRLKKVNRSYMVIESCLRRIKEAKRKESDSFNSERKFFIEFLRTVKEKMPDDYISLLAKTELKASMPKSLEKKI